MHSKSKSYIVFPFLFLVFTLQGMEKVTMKPQCQNKTYSDHDFASYKQKELELSKDWLHVDEPYFVGKIIASYIMKPILNRDFYEELVEVKVIKAHDYYIKSLSISPNGKVVASGASNGIIKLHDIETGNCISCLEVPDERDANYRHYLQDLLGNPVGVLVFNHNGNLLASASDDYIIRLWDVESAVINCTLIDLSCNRKSHKNQILSIAFSPCGKFLASASADCTIKLWNIEAKMLLRLLKAAPWQQRHHAHGGWVRSIAFHPNGSYLVSGGYDCRVKVWDTITGKLVASCADPSPVDGAHRAEVTFVRYLPDGSIASADEGGIKLWNSKRELVSHNKFGSASIDLSSDGNFFAIGLDNGDVSLVDVKTSQLRFSKKCHRHWVQTIALKNNVVASSADDRDIVLWKFDDPSKKALQEHGLILLATIVDRAYEKQQKNEKFIICSGTDEFELLTALPQSIQNFLRIHFNIEIQ